MKSREEESKERITKYSNKIYWADELPEELAKEKEFLDDSMKNRDTKIIWFDIDDPETLEEKKAYEDFMKRKG